MKKLLWIGSLSYLVIGIAHVIGGSVLEELIAYYGVSYKDGGQWIMNQFSGFLIGVLLTPVLTSRLGKRTTVLIALGLLTVSEAGYSLLPDWGWMLAFAPVAGFGFGMTEAVVGAMIIDLIKGKAAAMSRLETFFGVGALLIPITAAYLIQEEIWQFSFPIVAAMAGISFVFWLTLSFGKLDGELGMPVREKKGEEKNDGKPGTPLSLGYDSRALSFLMTAAMFFMIYVGLEMSFSNYLPSILLIRTGMSDVSSTAALSLFWLMVVAGRLFAGIIAERIRYGRYLLLTTLGSVATFMLMAFFDNGALTLLFVALSGLFFSGIFGIALVYANSLLPGQTERTTSLLVASGGIGGAIFPRLTGWMMDRYDVQATIEFITVLVAFMLCVLLMMLWLGKRHAWPGSRRPN
ncbi:MFS transporter [Paenibacillus sp. HB172176]|uniref:MFS transporter n=1 Tax=Paenibacillus sp. HB172176 TaxID=2493690 RepID=UPI00143B9A16|nr:MFS transporter [Paenibacillus sp. HB172176]